MADSCVSVNSITPRFDGTGWVVEIDSSRPSDMICTAVLASFEEVVPLDVDGLAAGTYTVQVEDKTSSFTLDSDNSTTEHTPSDIEIFLERTPCFGFCPTYTVTIAGDGTIIFNGLDHVHHLGVQTATIEPAQVQLLAEQIMAAGYFDWNDGYTAYEITDLPSVSTAVTINGQSKRIEHYLGDSSAPELLHEIEDLIDTAVNTNRWIEPDSATH